MPDRKRIRWGAEAKASFDRSGRVTQIDAEPVLLFLSAGFFINWFKETNQRVWMAIIKPTEKLAQHFSLSMEYVVIGHGFPNDFQQRTLLAEPPLNEMYRVDPRIRFVASAAPLMRASCAAWAAQKRIAVIPLDPQEVSSEEDDLSRIYEILTAALWRRDVFDDSEPVTDPAEFFGRQHVVQEVVTKAFLGQPTAVFGLRKIGKSSLIRRVQGLLDADTSHITATALILCNNARIKSGRWWAVAADVLRGWAKAVEKRAEQLGSPVRPRISRLDELIRDGRTQDAAAVAEAFERDYSKLVRAAKQLQTDHALAEARFVAFFDEVDHLYPHLPDSGYWSEDYFLLWNTLQAIKRGLDDPAEIVYVLGGVNPAGVELGSIKGRPNPLFEMTKLVLGPLSLRESKELLTGFGSRVGFIFNDDSIERAYAITGGHPWLLRKLGSKLHKANISRSEQMTVTGAEVSRTFERTKRDFYAHVDWILNHLRDVAPDEFRLLKDIAVGGRDKYLTDWSDQAFRDTFAEHLSQYGLLKFESEHPEIAVGLVRDALLVPVASALPEQKRQLREAIDMLEASARVRLRLDLSASRDHTATVEAIVAAIPKEADNRQLGRDDLVNLGQTAGLQALLEALNWSDYLLLFDKYNTEIRWTGVAKDWPARLVQLKNVVSFVHLVRHNNDAELRSVFEAEGFDRKYADLLAVHEMVTG